MDIFHKEAKLGDLIRLWRQNFIESMNPKYLPKGWSVEHTIDRSFGQNSIFNKNATKEEEEKEEERINL